MFLACLFLARKCSNICLLVKSFMRSAFVRIFELFFFPVFTFYIARVLHNLAEIHTRVFMRKLKGVGKSKGKEKLERFASMKIYFGGYS